MKRTVICLVALSLAGLPTLTGCGGGGGAAVVQPPEQKKVMSVAINSAVLDAATDIPFANDTNPVTLVVYGDDANKVVDGAGKSLYDVTGKFAGPLTSKTGLFTIYINPGTPVPDKLVLRVVASAKDYITSSEEVLISKAQIKTDGTTTQINASVKLVKQTAPPSSVAAVTSAPVAIISGTTQTAVTVATPKDAASVNNVNLGQATVAIPASTTVYADVARTQPLSGNIKVAVTYNNNNTADSLSTFPGGFIVREDTGGNSLTSPGAFISGGFASITVTDANGNTAKTFDKPVDVTLTVPKGTINPTTGVAAKTGDTIPIWSYDTTKGEWSVQTLKNGTIVTGTLGSPDADGNFPVTFKTDHLSYFNLDWFAYGSGAMCNAPITIKGAKGNRIYLEAKLTGSGWLHPWWLDAGEPDPATNTITYAPTYPMAVTAWLGSKSNANLLKTFSFNTLCGGITLDLTADVERLLPQKKFGNVSVDVFEVCSENSSIRTAVPSDGVSAVASGQPVVSTVTDKSGHAVLNNLVANTLYRFTANNRDGRSASVDYTVKEGNNAIPAIIFPVTCTPPTGTTGGTGGAGTSIGKVGLKR